jgi:hypothetical protein
MNGKLLSLATAAALLVASTATGLAQNSNTDQGTGMTKGAATGHMTGDGGVQQMGQSGVKGDAGKGVRDTHSTGQDIKQEHPGMGMSTDTGNK